MMDLSALDRHEKIALQFSGGKDSLACLFLLKDYWERLTVYHLNSGDSFPERRAVVSDIRNLVPNFIEVRGYSNEVRQWCGIPSDIIPTSSELFAKNNAGQKKVPIIGRYDCCFQSINLPLHRQMIADGITLIIRGQKSADADRSHVQSGDVLAGVEFQYPLDVWTDDTVLEYLAAIEAPIPRFYETMQNAPDCMTCTGWLEKGLGAYLREYHPSEFAVYQERLRFIEKEVAPFCDRLNAEISP